MLQVLFFSLIESFCRNRPTSPLFKPLLMCDVNSPHNCQNIDNLYFTPSEDVQDLPRTCSTPHTHAHNTHTHTHTHTVHTKTSCMQMYTHKNIWNTCFSNFGHCCRFAVNTALSYTSTECAIVTGNEWFCRAQC